MDEEDIPEVHCGVVGAVQHDIHLTWEWIVSRCCLLIAITAWWL